MIDELEQISRDMERDREERREFWIVLMAGAFVVLYFGGQFAYYLMNHHA